MAKFESVLQLSILPMNCLREPLNGLNHLTINIVSSALVDCTNEKQKSAKILAREFRLSKNQTTA